MFYCFSSETALTWFAMDFTDDPSGKLEKLAVRFKLAETKDDFKKAFETAQSKLKTSGPVVERAQLVQVSWFVTCSLQNQWVLEKYTNTRIHGPFN